VVQTDIRIFSVVV